MSSQVDLRILYGLTSREWERMLKVETSQRELHDMLRRKNLIGEEELRSLDCKCYEEFATYWTRLLERTKSDFDHRKGWKKWARKYQSFATGADHFMKDFSPIVELTRAAGPPYSDLAVGTITALFTIACAKSRTDDIISSAITSVKDRLPGFQMYKAIYKDPNERNNRLGKAILLAYTGFIELATEATKYYLKTGMTRWWTAAWNPEKFQRMASNAQDLVSAVRLQCEELLSWNVNEIRQQNEALRKKVTRLEEDNDHRNLLELQALFDLPTWSLEQRREEIHAYKQSIDRERGDDQLFETMRYGSIARYKREALHFKEWESSAKSSMLLIIGSNHSGVAGQRHHCWMSPLALDIIVDCHSAAGAAATFYAFYVFGLYQRTHLYTALSEILFQLFKWKYHDLGSRRDEFATLSTKLKEYRAININANDDNYDAKLEALHHVAATVMQLYQSFETVYIILDRIDRCEADEQADFLNFLVKIMEDAPCSVKVLAIANKTSWDVENSGIMPRKRAHFRQVVESQNLLLQRRS